MNRVLTTLVIGCLLPAGFVHADEPGNQPRPVPATRPDMKQLLEDMKTRKPRIPLPELTEAEKEKLGERGGGYENRLRFHYMPGGNGRGGFGGFGFGKEADPKASLTYEFKTRLFWIVSRTNNCQFCLGHQEWKLAVVGMKEEEIAALDCDWAAFPPAQQAAFAFARKITYEPHRIADANVDALRKHYTDVQILEMILSVAGNNSINRWKEGVGSPQSKEGGGFNKKGTEAQSKDPPPVLKSFLNPPTPEKYKDTITKVAPLQLDAKTGAPSRATVCVRPTLETRAEVEKALAACRKRTPRLPLVDEAQARALLPEDAAPAPVPQWVRLLANFPSDGKGRIAGIRSAESKGDLKPLLKAQLSWIIARQDRAWYAVGQAKQRLKDLGLTDDQIYQLDGSCKDYAPADRALFTVARNLAASPVVLTDDEVSEAVKLAGPRNVVQAISYTTHCASFDRITEAAGLQLER